MIIWGLWDCQVDAIIDVNLGDADADMSKYELMTSHLSRLEKIKKDDQGKHCHNQQKHYSPFVISVDRMLGREALVLLSKLSGIMAEKR